MKRIPKANITLNWRGTNPMTTDEMLQLLLKGQEQIKLGQAKLEERQDRFETKQARIEECQNRFEIKLDVAIADIAQIKKDVSLLLEHDEIDTFNINAAHKEINEVNSKFDKLDRQSNVIRVLDKSVPNLHARVSDLEDELRDFKSKFGKAS